MKFFVLISLVLMLIASPALAASGRNGNSSSNGQGQSNNQKNNQDDKDNNSNISNSSSNSTNNRQNSKSEDENEDNNDSDDLDSDITSASSSGREKCDPGFPWKNHGEYISCVAKLKEGGDSVSKAAKSDIGKRNKNASGSATPSARPSPEASSSGLISTVTQDLKSVRHAVDNLKDQIEALLELLNPFD